jgi:hypothetical protein
MEPPDAASGADRSGLARAPLRNTAAATTLARPHEDACGMIASS